MTEISSQEIWAGRIIAMAALLVVGVWFYRRAQASDQSKVKWVALGLISYFLGSLVVSLSFRFAMNPFVDSMMSFEESNLYLLLRIVGYASVVGGLLAAYSVGKRFLSSGYTTAAAEPESSASPAPWDEAAFGRDSEAESLEATYESTKHGISFHYPANWSIQGEDELEGFNTRVVRVGHQQTRKPSLVLTVVVMAPTEKDDDIEGYLRTSKSQFANAFPGFKAHSYERTSFQDHDAAWMEHSYDGNNGRVREATMTIFVDQQYISLPLQFVFESPSDGFRHSVATFKEILKSVKINVGGLKGNVEIQYV